MMKTENKFLLIVLIVLLAAILGMRSDNTPDTAAYRVIYELSYQDLNYEILYIKLNRIFYSLGVSFDSFLILLTITLFLVWYKITAYIINNKFVAYLSFLPFYGLYFFGIILRASIAVVICYFAIVFLLRNKNFKGYLLYFLCVLIASAFHMTALVFLILPFIADRIYGNKLLFGLLILSGLMPLFNSYIPMIKNVAYEYLDALDFNRVEGYVSSGGEEMLYSLTLFKTLIFGGGFVVMRNRIVQRNDIYNFFLNTYIIGCLLMSVFSFVTAGSRLAMLFLFFEFILLTLIYEASNMEKKKTLIFILLAMIINFIAIIQKGNGLLW